MTSEFRKKRRGKASEGAKAVEKFTTSVYAIASKIRRAKSIS
jgi:hypothetical protein